MFEIMVTRGWDSFPQETNEVGLQWIDLLLGLVDFKADALSKSLVKFTRCKVRKVKERIQKDVIMKVCDFSNDTTSENGGKTRITFRLEKE